MTASDDSPRELSVTENARDGAPIDRLTPAEILSCFEEEDVSLTKALAARRAEIIAVGAAMARALRSGGRVIYVGAGTSGRIGALDAAEWPPTFGVSPDRVLAVMVGGAEAFARAVEGAEDRRDEATAELRRLKVSSRDFVLGISASGSAAFVRAALDYARETRCARALLTANEAATPDDSELVVVGLGTGAELLTGSTRLSAATATHRVLQRASNLCAVELGWIHNGLMVEMRPTNQKLRARAIRIVSDVAEVDEGTAERCLEAADADIKVAIVGARFGDDPIAARARLESVGRRLKELPGLD